MRHILLVDGYNVIGSWPSLREIRDTVSLQEARDRLISLLDEYAAMTSEEVVLVFDAIYQQPGLRKPHSSGKVVVLFSRAGETADQVIERVATRLVRSGCAVRVATSDAAEQSYIFGIGALRCSTRELWAEMAASQQAIAQQLREQREQKMRLGERIDPKLYEKLEHLPPPPSLPQTRNKHRVR